MKKVTIEYIGCGLFDARVSESEVRGVGNSEIDALASLFRNLREEEVNIDLAGYSIKIAV